jgi:energy-coupling factor transporter transmembrane protein EcfT
MSRIPPSAVLLATFVAVLGVVIADAQATVIAWGAPALLAVLASRRGRRTLARRLLASAPLLGLSVLIRWLGHATISEPLLPVLRVVSAIAWASGLSTWLGPTELHSALRTLGAPRALVELIAHTRRFALQLAETASQAWDAAVLRGGLSSRSAIFRTVGQVAGVVLVRAFDRAECVAISAALRGGHLPEATLAEPLRASQALHDLGCSP